MHHRTLWLQLIVLAAAAGFWWGPALSQENVKTVDDSAFVERMRPRAVFFHDDHNEKAGIEDCGKCHHVYKDGRIIEGETSEDKECSACHLGKKGNNLIDLTDIYHRQCKACHVEKKKGPLMCNECHVRK